MINIEEKDVLYTKMQQLLDKLNLLSATSDSYVKNLKEIISTADELSKVREEIRTFIVTKR